MVGGAVLNAAAFIGGDYLARALGGANTAAQKKKKCDMIKFLRCIKQLTPNARATAPNLLTGLRQARK